MPPLESKTGAAPGRLSIWWPADRQSTQWQATATIGRPTVSSTTLPQTQDDFKRGVGTEGIVNLPVVKSCSSLRSRFPEEENFFQRCRM
jgi:hypothetical protein